MEEKTGVENRGGCQTGRSVRQSRGAREGARLVRQGRAGVLSPGKAGRLSLPGRAGPKCSCGREG